MTIRAHHHFDTTAPAILTCRACHRPTIYGLADGVITHADPAPIDAAGELRALAAGYATYTLRPAGLIYRDPSRRTDPALASPVLAEHRCPRRPR